MCSGDGKWCVNRLPVGIRAQVSVSKHGGKMLLTSVGALALYLPWVKVGLALLLSVGMEVG